MNNTCIITKEELNKADDFFTHAMQTIYMLGAPLTITPSEILSTDDVIVTGYIESSVDPSGDFITYRW